MIFLQGTSCLVTAMEVMTEALSYGSVKNAEVLLAEICRPTAPGSNQEDPCMEDNRTAQGRLPNVL